MEEKQEAEQEEQTNILSGKVLSFGYNTINIRESKTKRERSIYFDGLQKRVLSGIDDDVLKRLKFIEFTDTEEFWNIGINLFACCDKCGSALFSICNSDDFYDKNECPNCKRWLCSDCTKQNGLCNNCMKKQMVANLR